MLSRYGHKATAVGTGMDALAAMGDARFDVALVDLDMPGMSGAETIRALREVDVSMRLLVVSGRSDRAHVLEALDAGADGYLIKDELGEGLGRALQELIAGKSPLSAGVGAILVRQVTGRQPPEREVKVQEIRKRPITDRGDRVPQGDRSGELIIGGIDLPKKIADEN